VSVRVVPWIVVLVSALASHASADDDRRARDVAGALDAGAYGEAYRLAMELVAERPEDARAHELAAAAALETYRLAEAARHLDAALALRPGDAQLLGQRARLRLGLADEAGARVDAELAVYTNADAVARAVLDELVLTERARDRLAGEDPGLPTGSAPAFVDVLCAAFARRDLDAVARSFDPSFLDGLAAQLSPAQRATSPDPLRSFAQGLFDFADNAAATNSQEFFGWLVAAEPTVEGDVTWVDVQLPARVTYTAQSVALFAAAVADPAARDSVDTLMRARYNGVSPEERPAMLQRIVGLRVRSVVPLRFAVRRSGDGWRVTDVVANGVSMKQLTGNIPRMVAAAPPLSSTTPRSGDDSPRVLAVLALGVAALAAFVYYVRRRDDAERRWRRERSRR
jgi:hypothetical protein